MSEINVGPESLQIRIGEVVSRLKEIYPVLIEDVRISPEKEPFREQLAKLRDDLASDPELRERVDTRARTDIWNMQRIKRKQELDIRERLAGKELPSREDMVGWQEREQRMEGDLDAYRFVLTVVETAGAGK